ncbi:CYTH domain-containing protein [Vagococcus intermedius]|uniref:CYTH domain-containing protein n=1 Tax=Vagococcus intermedius TaxID=2991418 RepID=A0AAF0CVN0_9ENTE|nr:CYTH domain-containing protein [Vagococcus intermedius]WEG73699.1 CYTH domain-containing protein [Vagococcus intermedius]WEG75783.1 CYTH domain-containing protein [Vagococcus intermedius]
MSQEVEIEFKTRLTSKQYAKLMTDYNLTEQDCFTQTNNYFDTPDHLLKKQKMGLRIRLLPTEAELTLKSPLVTGYGLLETTDKLTLTEAKDLIDEDNILLTGNVATYLKDLGIDPIKLTSFGQLTTKRAEVALTPDNLLVLDESWYHGQHDFELEMEVKNAESGKAFFVNFLNRHGIPYSPTKNKIERTFAAKMAE